MGISGFFGKRNIYCLDVYIELPDEVFANTQTFLKVTVKNPRRFLPAFLIRLQVGQSSRLLAFIDCKSTETLYIPVKFKTRGKNKIDTITISSVYPFNFFIRFRQIPCNLQFVVFAEPKECVYLKATDKGSTQGSLQSSDSFGSIGDIQSLRKYEYGDPLKLIHWKATARTSELITKEFSSQSESPVVVDLEQLNMSNFEDKLSCATMIILQCFRHNQAVGLRTKDTFFEPSLSRQDKLKMLRHLALL